MRALPLLLVAAVAACSETPPPASPGPGSAAPPAGSAAPPPAKPGDKGDTIGGLRLGLPAADAVKLLGEPAKKAPGYEEGASGLWLSVWSWPGVELTMEGGKGGAPQAVHFIQVSAPSPLKTPSGVGIGTPRADVMAAYGAIANKPKSRDDAVLIGDEYGGTIFRLEAGKVSSVLIGTFAE